MKAAALLGLAVLAATAGSATGSTAFGQDALAEDRENTTPPDQKDGQAGPAGDTDERLTPTQKVSYSTTMEVETHSDLLLPLLHKVSRLKSNESRPPFSMALLHRRARDDLKLIQKTLRSEGFYDGQVDYQIAESDGGRAEVTVIVDPGPEYTFGQFDLVLSGGGQTDDTLLALVDKTPTPLAQRARARLVIDAETRLLAQFANHGYPQAMLATRKVLVNHGTRRLLVTIDLNTGPRVLFGGFEISGLDDVERPYVATFKTWEEGDPFSQAKIDEFKSELYQTGLFQAVDVSFRDARPADSIRQRQVTVSAREAKQRTIGAGVLVSSSDGVGGNVFWEHRNILGRGERLRADLEATTLEQFVGVKLTKPNFMRRAQTLRLRATGGRQDVEAFQEVSVLVSAGLDRPLGGRWQLSVDAEAELLEVEQNLSKESFQLFSIATRLLRDTTDNPLAPTRGSRLRLMTAPHLSLGSGATPYIVNEASASVYRSIGGRVTLASRARLGSIVGAERLEIPASERFYAGGGRSIRGFDFQQVGPLDEFGDPSGGRSVFEINFEPRFRVTDKISVIPFVDAGFVSTKAVPDLSEDIRVGAGLGVAYETPVGPIRVDLARAIDRRAGTDDAIEFYISLGHAF